MKKCCLLLVAAVLFISAISFDAFAEGDVMVSEVRYKTPIYTAFVERSGISYASNNEDEEYIRFVMSCPTLQLYVKEEIKPNDTITLKLHDAQWFFVDTDLNGGEFSLYNASGLPETYDKYQGKWDNFGDLKGEYTRGSASDPLYKLSLANTYDYGKLTFLKTIPQGSTIEIPLVTRTQFSDGINLASNQVLSDMDLESYVSVSSGIAAIASEKVMFATTKSKDEHTEAEQKKESSNPTATAQARPYSDQVKQVLDKGNGAVFEIKDAELKKQIDESVINVLSDANEPFRVSHSDLYAYVPAQLFKGAKTLEVQFTPVNVPASVKTRLDGMNAANAKLYTNAYRLSVLVDGTELKTYEAPVTFGFKATGITLDENQMANLSLMHMPDADAENFSFAGGKRYTNQSIDLQISEPGSYCAAVAKELITIILQIDNPGYTVNSVQKTAAVAPEIIDSSTYVPLRFVSEALQANVAWDDPTKTAKITLGAKTLEITLNEPIPGFTVMPILKNDSMLVPLRYVSEKLDATVSWNEADRTITIIK